MTRQPSATAPSPTGAVLGAGEVVTASPKPDECVITRWPKDRPLFFDESFPEYQTAVVVGRWRNHLIPRPATGGFPYNRTRTCEGGR
jgi:hypothetical protein